MKGGRDSQDSLSEVAMKHLSNNKRGGIYHCNRRRKEVCWTLNLKGYKQTKEMNGGDWNFKLIPSVGYVKLGGGPRGQDLAGGWDCVTDHLFHFWKKPYS